MKNRRKYQTQVKLLQKMYLSQPNKTSTSPKKNRIFYGVFDTNKGSMVSKTDGNLITKNRF
jgi:hypothetical protein